MGLCAYGLYHEIFYVPTAKILLLRIQRFQLIVAFSIRTKQEVAGSPDRSTQNGAIECSVIGEARVMLLSHRDSV